MKMIVNIGMFLIPAIFLYIVHIKGVYRKGGDIADAGKH